jgi:hypothetical protein
MKARADPWLTHHHAAVKYKQHHLDYANCALQAVLRFRFTGWRASVAMQQGIPYIPRTPILYGFHDRTRD